MGLLTVWGALGILSMCEEPEAPMSIPDGYYSYAQYAPCWAWQNNQWQWVSGQEYTKNHSYDGYYGIGGSAFVDFDWNRDGDTHFKVQVGLTCDGFFDTCYCSQEVTRNFMIEINQDTKNDPAFYYLEQYISVYSYMDYYQGWRGCTSLEPTSGGIIRDWFNKLRNKKDYEYICVGFYDDYICTDGYEYEYCYTYYDIDDEEQEYCYSYYYCIDYEYTGDYNYFCFYDYSSSSYYDLWKPIRLDQMQYMYSDTCDKQDPCSKTIYLAAYPYYDFDDNKIWLENSGYFIFDIHTNEAMVSLCSILIPTLASFIWQ